MSKSLDTFRPDLLAAHADQIAKDGFTSVITYYFLHSEFKRPLTRAEAALISAAGLFLLSVVENGCPTSADYFSAGKGAFDAGVAVSCAAAAGQPASTVIYFAVDYDAAESDLAAISAYFAAAQQHLKLHSFTAGVYGSGLVCREVKEKGLVSHTWLSESKGFAGYQSWQPHADITQSPSGPYLGMDIDLDSTDGNAGGWKL